MPTAIQELTDLHRSNIQGTIRAALRDAVNAANAGAPQPLLTLDRLDDNSLRVKRLIDGRHLSHGYLHFYVRPPKAPSGDTLTWGTGYGVGHAELTVRPLSSDAVELVDAAGRVITPEELADLVIAEALASNKD